MTLRLSRFEYHHIIFTLVQNDYLIFSCICECLRNVKFRKRLLVINIQYRSLLVLVRISKSEWQRLSIIWFERRVRYRCVRRELLLVDRANAISYRISRW